MTEAALAEGRRFQKNALEGVRVYRECYRARGLLHARIFFQDENGEWRPTKRGPTLAAQQVEGAPNDAGGNG